MLSLEIRTCQNTQMMPEMYKKNRKVIWYRFPGLFSLDLNFQFGRWWPSWNQMFGLVKIQEMIPGNKHILLKTSFSCEIQQVIWVIWLKTEKMELVDGGPLEFRYLDSSKYKNGARNGLSMPHLVGKVILHRFLWPFTFKLHFQYGRRRPSWILMVGLVKIQKRYQKWKLVGKVVLHSFRY